MPGIWFKAVCVWGGVDGKVNEMRLAILTTVKAGGWTHWVHYALLLVIRLKFSIIEYF